MSVKRWERRVDKYLQEHPDSEFEHICIDAIKRGDEIKKLNKQKIRMVEQYQRLETELEESSERYEERLATQKGIIENHVENERKLSEEIVQLNRGTCNLCDGYFTKTGWDNRHTGKNGEVMHEDCDEC